MNAQVQQENTRIIQDLGFGENSIPKIFSIYFTDHIYQAWKTCNHKDDKKGKGNLWSCSFCALRFLGFSFSEYSSLLSNSQIYTFLCLFHYFKTVKRQFEYKRLIQTSSTEKCLDLFQNKMMWIYERLSLNLAKEQFKDSRPLLYTKPYKLKQDLSKLISIVIKMAC